MSIWASICLVVSRATPTTMITEVPPMARELYPNRLPVMMGAMATMDR